MWPRLGAVLLFKKESLPEVFDILFDYRGEKHHPTLESVEKINEHLQIRLPADFIEFCKCSKNYEAWFCSIGNNYSDHNHIIRANSLYKNTRRRVGKHSRYSAARKHQKGSWVSIKDKEHVVLRVGHDDHCLVMKVNEQVNNEDYIIQYWSPGYEREFGDEYVGFSEYILSLLNHCYYEAPGEKQLQCDELK